MDLALYRETVERIRGSGSDVLINLTTGAGARWTPSPDDASIPGPGTTLVSSAKRLEHIIELTPDICSLDMGSINFGYHVFVNSPQSLIEMARAIRKAGIKPELEVFEAGHIRFTRHLLDKGEIAEPTLFQIVLGVPWGAPATTEAMVYMRDLLPPGAQWAVFGISAAEFPMAAQAAILGGHVRVGLEDNLYMAQGVLAPSNTALVERAVEIIRAIGAEVATPEEARHILCLPATRAAPMA
jgi:uncharacterized protein (DUF849 family)